MVKVARILRTKAGTKKLVDYDAYEDDGTTKRGSSEEIDGWMMVRTRCGRVSS